MENREELKKQLMDVFEAAELTLASASADAFLSYYELLAERNKVMNLTAITEPEDVFVKHFLDSAILWKLCGDLWDEAPDVIDVGSGAGFPGIPLKILRPEISITLLDALNKRVGFLREVTETLELTDVQAVHARSEDAGAAGSAFREHYDLAVSRAVSALPVLSEYCLPFVRVGGWFIAYKSGEIEEEIKSAEHALGILGGSLDKVISYTIPNTDISRALLLIRKERETPKQYPRKAGKPEKKPL